MTLTPGKRVFSSPTRVLCVMCERSSHSFLSSVVFVSFLLSGRYFGTKCFKQEPIQRRFDLM